MSVGIVIRYNRNYYFTPSFERSKRVAGSLETLLAYVWL